MTCTKLRVFYIWRHTHTHTPIFIHWDCPEVYPIFLTYLPTLFLFLKKKPPPQLSISESGSLGNSSGSDVTSLSSQLPDTPNSMVPSPVETWERLLNTGPSRTLCTFSLLLAWELSATATQPVKLFSLFKNPAPSCLLSDRPWLEVFRASPDFAKQGGGGERSPTSQEFWSFLPPPQIPPDYTRMRLRSCSCSFRRWLFPFFLLFFLHGRKSTQRGMVCRAIQMDPQTSVAFISTSSGCPSPTHWWLPSSQLPGKTWNFFCLRFFGGSKRGDLFLFFLTLFLSSWARMLAGKIPAGLVCLVQNNPPSPIASVKLSCGWKVCGSFSAFADQSKLLLFIIAQQQWSWEFDLNNKRTNIGWENLPILVFYTAWPSWKLRKL